MGGAVGGGHLKGREEGRRRQLVEGGHGVIGGGGDGAAVGLEVIDVRKHRVGHGHDAVCSLLSDGAALVLGEFSLVCCRRSVCGAVVQSEKRVKSFLGFASSLSSPLYPPFVFRYSISYLIIKIYETRWKIN